MAKIKTTAHEDNLSVIAEELKQMQEIVQNLENNISKSTQNQAVYQRVLENERIESMKTLKLVISQEIASLNGIRRDIVSLEQRVQESIKKTSLNALQEVKGAVLIKSKTSKQVIWMLGICGILVALATIGSLVKQSSDQETITGAIEQKAKYECLMNDLKEWAKDNPRDAKSFTQWAKDRAVQ